MKKIKALLILFPVGFILSSCLESEILEKPKQIDYLNGRVIYAENVTSENWKTYKTANGLKSGKADLEIVFDFNQLGNFNFTRTISDCAYLEDDARILKDKVITKYSVNYREVESISEISELNNGESHQFKLTIESDKVMSSRPINNIIGDVPFLIKCSEKRDESQYEIKNVDAQDIYITSRDCNLNSV